MLAGHGGRVYATHVHSWEIFLRMVPRTRHVMYMFNQVHEMISVKLVFVLVLPVKLYRCANTMYML